MSLARSRISNPRAGQAESEVLETFEILETLADDISSCEFSLVAMILKLANFTKRCRRAMNIWNAVD